MKKKTVGRILKMFTGAFALALMLGISVQAKEVTVQNGDIQAALDEAKDATEDVTVTIPAGEYTISRFLYVYPNTTINAEGATIHNNSSTTPIITQENVVTADNLTINGGTWITDTGSVIDLLGVKNLSLNNMTVSGTASNAGYHFTLRSCEGVTVTNCILNGASLANIYLKNSNNVELTGVTLAGSAKPIAFDSNDTVLIKDSDFSGNSQNRLVFESGDKNYVLTNVSGIGSIVVGNNNTGFKISGCTFATSSEDSVVVVKADGTVISSNTISNAHNNAITVEDASNVIVENNQIIQPGYLGIAMRRCTGNEVIGNTLTSCGWHSILLEDDNGSEISGNTITGSAAKPSENSQGEGLVVDRSTNTVVSNNTVSDTHSFFANWGNGIIVNTDSKDVTIEGNTVSNSGNHGIQVSYRSQNVTVKNNIISGSGRMGISVSRGANANLSGNNISDSAVDGIVFDGKEGTVNGSIDNCTITGSKDKGIVLEAAHVTMNGNTIKDSASYGVSLSEGAMLTANSNNIYQTNFSADGIGVVVTDGCTLTFNNNYISNFGSAGLIINRGASVSAEKNQVNNSKMDAFSLNAYYIMGNTNNISNHQLIPGSITSTSASGQGYYANCEVGVVINGTKYSTQTDGSGKFTITYPEIADTSKIVLYMVDDYGNAICLQATPDFSLSGAGNVNQGDVEQVRAFVSRLYTVALNREAEEKGLNDWTEKLVKQERNGAEVAYGFFLSEEMTQKGLSDEEFVDVLYRAMFDREPDAGGKAGWLKDLQTGFSREWVYRGFAESQEFQNLCDKFGIIRGYVTTGETRDQNRGVTEFVSRIYFKALDRKELDTDGLNDWCGRILSGTSPSDVVWGFIFSAEFKNRNLNDDQFLQVMYATYFDREADEAGYNDWINKMQSGTTREEVVKGFSGSEEFYNLVESFGLSN